MHPSPILLAHREGLGEVRLCTCGIVSLHLGDVVLRLPGTALPHLDHLLQDAHRALAELAGPRLRPANATHQIH